MWKLFSCAVLINCFHESYECSISFEGDEKFQASKSWWKVHRCNSFEHLLGGIREVVGS
jgi:hypothetical protein